MTINTLWKIAVYLCTCLVGFITFYKLSIKNIVDKIKDKNLKIERGAELDDQYEQDHEIIIKMANTVERIDKKLDKDIMLTLRNTIMNKNLSHEERLEAYYDYKKLGGNGLVKEYAEKNLIKDTKKRTDLK